MCMVFWANCSIDKLQYLVKRVKSMLQQHKLIPNYSYLLQSPLLIISNNISLHFIVLHCKMDLKKHELNEKLQQNEGFYKQMIKADQSYKTLKVHAHYENLSAVNEILVSKFQSEKGLAIDTYFVYGIYINEDKVSMDLITQYFVTVFPKYILLSHRPKKPYFFVYFNDHDSPNNFSNFRDMLRLMPIEYFINLEAIFLVRPSLRMKASRYFTFGTISKYINSKTINIDSLEELSQRLGVKKNEIMKFVPAEVRNYFLQEEEKTQLQVPTRITTSTSSGPTYNRQTQKISPNNSANNSPNSSSTKPIQMTMTQKPNSNIVSSNIQQGPPQPIKLEIDTYDKSQRGIPAALEVMLHYFREHGNQLEQEGIFRKSVSIEDETIAIERMNNKQYDFLEKTRDPHLVANLIKRFLSKLKTPLIPYQIFDQLMTRQPLNSLLISEQMKQLSYQNITKYLTLAILLDFLIRKVIPRAHKNKMPAQNVAICFAPCVMWAEQRSIKDLAYINKSVAVFLIMINNFQEIFGSKKELNKIFRSSFYEQQKKNIVETYNIPLLEPQHVQSVQQQRKTPNFGQLVLQKNHHELKGMQDDDSPFEQQTTVVQKPNQMQINIISPNKLASKSHVQKSELAQTQQGLQLNRKSNRSLKKYEQEPIPNSTKIEPPSPLTGNPNNRKKPIFSSQIESPKSQNINIQSNARVSSNKSDQEINSIHSNQ